MTKEEFEGRIHKIEGTTQTKPLIDQLWADIEADRGVVVDWSKAPEWATEARTYFVGFGYKIDDHIAKIPRPAPKYRDLTRDDKGSALYDKEIILSPIWESISDQTLDDLCKAAGIETRVVVK